MKKLIVLLSLLFIVINTSQAQDSIIDPTRPVFGAVPTPKEKTKAKKDMTLSAIFFKQGKRSAIISDNLYQEGDSFSGNKVVSINSTSVLLKSSDGYRRLKLINKFKKLKK